MEKLIFLLLVVIGSAISTYFQNKKKREEEELEGRSPTPRKPSSEPPVPHWPKTGRDWQDELRRVLQGKVEQPQPPPQKQTSAPTPPPVIRTKIILAPSPKAQVERSEGDIRFPSPFTQSTTAYARAAQLTGRVESRLAAIDAQTEKHRPAQVTRRPGSLSGTVLRRWTRSRQSLREAFIASLIFSPPAALSQPQKSGRLFD